MKDVYHSSHPQAGDVLIARPDMPGNLFSRTLVYLQEYTPEGALGFILNRPLGQGIPPNDTLGPSGTCSEDILVYFGGPVQSDQLVLARFIPQGEVGFRCVCDGEVPGNLSSVEGSVTRMFLGYAGWSAGQLDEEITRNDWSWMKADRMFLKQLDGDCSWEGAVNVDQRWRIVRRTIPEDPEKN